jgi:hypothetical protein
MNPRNKDDSSAELEFKVQPVSDRHRNRRKVKRSGARIFKTKKQAERYGLDYVIDKIDALTLVPN